MARSDRFISLFLGFVFLPCVLLVAPSRAAAQATPSKPASPTGTLNGRVVCGDTKQPAHLADVFLVPKLTAAVADAKPQEGDGNAVSVIQARTQTDGSFTVRNLPPGDYFVVSHMAGYALPIAFDESAHGTEIEPAHADLAKILANFPTAHVVPNSTVTVDVSLTPGTALTGHIEFEDGTPVVGQWIEILSAEEHDPWRQPLGGLSDLSLWVHQAITDDEGRYRFAGLPPGKYWLFTIIQPEMDQRRTGASPFSGFIRQSFTVYAPGVFRKSMAKAIEVKGSEPQPIDANIIVSINHVHTVRGKVVASGDGHPLNYGFVSLKDPRDEKDFSRSTPLEADGTYHFADVPDGTYNLMISRAADVKPGGNPYSPTVIHTYGDGKASVTLNAQDTIVGNLVLDQAKNTAALK